MTMGVRHDLPMHFSATNSALLPAKEILVPVTYCFVTWWATAGFVSDKGTAVRSSRRLGESYQALEAQAHLFSDLW